MRELREDLIRGERQMLPITRLLTGFSSVLLFNLPIGSVLSAPLPNTVEIAQNMTKLEGTSWIFIGFASQNKLTPPLENTTLTLEFDKDSLSGTGGCNRYMGGYKLENGKIILSPLASTQMACLPPIMDQEFKFFNALNQAKTYKINTKGQLEITTTQGTLVFQSPTALDDAREGSARENNKKMLKLEGTSWIFIGFAANNQLIPPLENTTLTLEFDKDSLSGTGGCNRYMGGYKLENGKIMIPPLASTKMACPPPIMEQEFKFFNALNQAKTYKINTKGQLEITTTQGTLVFQSQSTVSEARSWLDQEKPQNWNQAGASVPKSPKNEDDDNLKRCSEQARKPSTPEDQALVKAGWTLFGPIQIYGNTSVRSAMSSADGMCRPMGYQEFVFVGGKFAGTLSPTPMLSRSDGAAVKTYLTSENALTTQFNRYTDKDPLCCPSGVSSVSYTIEFKNKSPLVVPQQTVNSEQ